MIASRLRQRARAYRVPPHKHLTRDEVGGSLADEELAAWVEHALLERLIRLQQNRRGNGEPERLRGPHVDEELVLHRPLDWQSPGLAPLRILSN